MLRAIFLCAILLLVLPRRGSGHATPTPVPVGRLHVEGNRLVDSTQTEFLLRGVQMAGLHASQPSETELRAVEAMTRFTFRVLRQRWNMNALRLPVSNRVWERDGESYLRKVAEVVRAANSEDLVVILAVFEDGGTGLPSPSVLNFWRVWANFFKDTPPLIFDVFNQPSASNVPGHIANRRQPLEWRFWLNGGVTLNGPPAIGMQALVDAIRSAGATQIIAVPGFHDSLDFQGFGPDYYIRDPHILYEAHPYYDHAQTDNERQANFGFLGGRFPLYAGEWGLPLTANRSTCQAVPRDTQKVVELVYQTLAYFDLRSISWTAASFEVPSLIRDFANFAPTALDRLWTCGTLSDPQPGMGGLVLLWMSGDEDGFGSIRSDQIASAAGGFTGPVAPGELIALYGQGVGPEPTAFGRLDAAGSLETGVAETRVLFDGIPGPVVSTGVFQLVVQVPYEVAGKQRVAVQAFYRGVPSNRVEMEVADAAPEIFVFPASFSVAALNRDGSPNSSIQPAEAGSVVALFATGDGETSPPGITGKPAQDPYPRPLLPVSLLIGGQPAEILYAGAAPGLVGVMQINARVPPLDPGGTRAAVILTVGSRSSRTGLTLWIK